MLQEMNKTDLQMKVVDLSWRRVHGSTSLVLHAAQLHASDEECIGLDTHSMIEESSFN